MYITNQHEHDDQDTRIVTMIRNGDQRGLVVLIRTHAAAARAVIRKRFAPRDWAIVEDAVIDAAMQMWRDPSAYDPARGPMRPYFIGIAIRCYLRLSRETTEMGDGFVGVAFSDAQYVTEKQTSDDRNRSWARAHAIRATIGAMPPLYRRVVEEDLASASLRADTREVARRCGITRNHVRVIRNRYQRALAHHHVSERNRRRDSA